MTKMIKQAPSKHCTLDPIPTQLLKHHVTAIAPAITGIYNSSVDQGTVSDNLKEALLKPLIKKPNSFPVSDQFQTFPSSQKH